MESWNFFIESHSAHPPPTAYETLLHDCMLGDATLFNRADAVDLSWQLVDPILDTWKQEGPKGLAFYPAGSWGPQEADDFIERDYCEWRRVVTSGAMRTLSGYGCLADQKRR